MQVITDHKVRRLLSVQELPPKAQADFSYLPVDSVEARIVKYRGAYYDVFDAQSTSALGFQQFKGWHGVVSETFFSGVLFRISDSVWEDEGVVVGRYFA